MKRLLVIVIGLLTAWFGLVHPPPAMANSTLIPTAYEYDSRVTPLQVVGTAIERGSPPTYDRPLTGPSGRTWNITSAWGCRRRPHAPADHGNTMTTYTKNPTGPAQVLGVKGNDIVVRVPNVTGLNHNPGAGFPNQATNVFFIKGSSSPSVVPYNPAWTP